LDNDTLYKDFNDIYDYKDYSDYDNYQFKISDMDNSNKSSTISYYEEQYTENVDDNEIYYDASPTVISNFLTDSTITEHFYTSSTLSQSETTASTTLESNVMEGILYFLRLFMCLINNYSDFLPVKYKLWWYQIIISHQYYNFPHSIQA